MFRAMAQTFIQVRNTTKASGMQIKEVAGVECTTLMVLFTKESGITTRKMEKAC